MAFEGFVQIYSLGIHPNYNISFKFYDHPFNSIFPMNPTVKLRNSDGEICTIRDAALMKKFATRWNYVLGNRRRWNQLREARQRVRNDAHKALVELGIKPKQLEEIAFSETVEVSTRHYADLEYGKETRLIPWEHLLTAGTKTIRGSQSLTVVRHLKGIKKKPKAKEIGKVGTKGSKAAAKKRAVEPIKFAFAGGAPEPLDQFRTFAAELDLVASGFCALTPREAPNALSLEQLGRFLQEAAPEVVHLSAFDAQYAEQRLSDYVTQEMTYCPETVDGIYLWDDIATNIVKISPEDIAACLTSAANKPELAVINSWYSGGTTAPACVAAGAKAAVGFHNSFDDQAAYAFFRLFYRAWNANGHDHLRAFQSAWKNIDVPSSKTRGTAISLWSPNSIAKKQPDSPADDDSTAVSVCPGFSPGPATLADPAVDRISELVGIEVQPLETLNYSLLHNRRSLMEKFHLWFRTPQVNDGRSLEMVKDIDVEVVLNIGDAAFTYQTKVNLGESVCQIDLADASLSASNGNPDGGVFVPLTSELFRSVDERMQTSLFIGVTWHDQTLYRHTHTVSLAPIDQWVMDEINIGWLPSFVQPRDPAVRAIIQSAQRYLRCIEDDPNAGFSGYQADDVNHQVKAIWSAIVYDFSLAYVSPPPSYNAYAQRLRSPRQVIDEDRGTCVDLAILFASCLEWIELHPVIFMTTQHAFVGYWTTDEAHEEFLKSMHETGRDFSTSDHLVAERFPWTTLPVSYEDVYDWAYADKLIPVEAVSLTTRSSFAAAKADGWFHFDEERNPEDHIRPESKDSEPSEGGGFGTFKSLVDISASRKFVTPLPIYGINN